MRVPNPISTFLWFESNADEAAKLYCTIFPRSKITSVTKMSTSFEIDPDPVKAGRVVQCMLGMQKIEIAALQRAHRGS